MLNRHNFEIAELAPNDEQRLYLCGILVSPGATSETDGHQAVIVTAVDELQPTLFSDAEEVIPAEQFTPFILELSKRGDIMAMMEWIERGREIKIPCDMEPPRILK